MIFLYKFVCILRKDIRLRGYCIDIKCGIRLHQNTFSHLFIIETRSSSNRTLSRIGNIGTFLTKKIIFINLIYLFCRVVIVIIKIMTIFTMKRIFSIILIRIKNRYSFRKVTISNHSIDRVFESGIRSFYRLNRCFITKRYLNWSLIDTNSRSIIIAASIMNK